MNSYKRKISNSQYFDQHQIKLQKTFNQTEKPINCFENLSNEIFYEIFEYLDGCDIYGAFIRINSRFRHILMNLSMPLKFNLQKKPTSTWNIYEKLIDRLKHQIISLQLNRIIEPCGSILINSSFNRLESLTLNLSNDQQLELLATLSSLPCLLALTLNVDKDYDYNLDIYPKIFSLSKLKYIKLSSEKSSKHIIQPMNTNDKSSLERLINDHDCTSNILFSYLLYNPQLLRLVCNKKLSQSNSTILPQLTIKPILTYIHINECHLTFDEFQLFIKEISLQLKVLRLSSVYNTKYLDADRWEKLIYQYIPNLSRLEFKYIEFIDEKLQIRIHHQKLQRFNRPFWIERQWYLHYAIGSGKVKKGMISYIIGPNQYNEKDSLINPSSTQLTVINSMFFRWFKLFINYIKPGLRLFQITRLVFIKDGISIDILLLLLKILSNLNSLVITSFVETDKKLFSISKPKQKSGNKIRKLYINRINFFHEIQYLIHLCSNIDYLQIDHIHKIDFEQFLPFILIKHRIYLGNNFSLHLRYFQYNEEIIQQLKSFIHKENLYNNWIITYTSNNIHLQYKKN